MSLVFAAICSHAPGITGREGGTWSFEVFCEPKNVCVSITDHHIPKWGAT